MINLLDFIKKLFGMSRQDGRRKGDRRARGGDRRVTTHDRRSGEGRGEKEGGTEGGGLPDLPAALREYVIWDHRYRRSPFGKTAMELGFLTDVQFDILMDIQKKDGGKIGALAVLHEFMTSEQVEECLDKQRLHIFVEESQAGNPAFLTWVHDCKKSGVLRRRPPALSWRERLNPASCLPGLPWARLELVVLISNIRKTACRNGMRMLEADR